MSKSNRNQVLSLALVLVAAGLLIASIKLPLWQMRMESPQYQDNEALHIKVFSTTMTGDLREIRVLNKYIGVHIPDALPQWKWLPAVIVCAAALSVLAIAFPVLARRRTLFSIPALLATAVLFSAAQAQWQMYHVGHQRDAHTALKGVNDFTMPLLGRVKIANFTITSTLGVGSYLICAAIILQFTSAYASRRCHPQTCCCAHKNQTAEIPKGQESVI